MPITAQLLAETTAATEQTGYALSGSLIYWLNQQLAGENEYLTMLFMFLGVALSAISAYLIGSISPIYLYAQKRYKEDIRKLGTCSADSFNIYEIYGFKDAVLSFLLDAADILMSVGIGFGFMAEEGAAIAMFFCFLGHLFPIFHKFKGGKGVAVMVIAPLFLNLWVFLIMVFIYIVIMLLSRFYSLASIMYAVMLPLILNSFCGGEYYADWYMYMSTLMLVFAIVAQWGNINLLLHGKGTRFDIGKKHVPLKIKEKEAEKPHDKSI